MRFIVIALLIIGSGITAWNLRPAPVPDYWTEQEIALIKSLSLSNLPPLPADPSNQYADNESAAKFGQQLYFDTRLSGSGNFSCASCHKPELYFTDGLELAVAAGAGTRHTPSLIGLSYSPWYYWDGRKDSQWSQALAPLEAINEHDTNRLAIARLIESDPAYLETYRTIFGELPELPALNVGAAPVGRNETMSNWNKLDPSEQDAINRVFSNVGKALAAYQRRLIPGRGRFDDYADLLDTSDPRTDVGELEANEISGLNLFIGRAQCINCHNGPLLTNHEFHNNGVLVVSGQLPPMGRYDGVRIARDDPFNCLGEYSDAEASECVELRFARDSNDLVGAHKTPTLRNIAETAPYMHGGQLATLDEVLRHYNEAPVSMLSHNEAKPLDLRQAELDQLKSFLLTLSAPLATDSHWLQAPLVTLPTNQ